MQHMPAFLRALIRRTLHAAALTAGLLAAPRLWVFLAGMAHTTAPERAPVRPVAIVFGAGLYRDGRPTPVLQDRVATAADLYFAGKVRKLLLSGSSNSIHYDEPQAMREYALRLGVPAEALALDRAGLRTYDTCYRARRVFGVQSAILVTQRFHLPRALYLCRQLGIEAAGVPADRQYYRKRARLFWQVRETLATLAALWEVHISHPRPVLDEPEPIFASGGNHEP